MLGRCLRLGRQLRRDFVAVLVGGEMARRFDVGLAVRLLVSSPAATGPLSVFKSKGQGSVLSVCKVCLQCQSAARHSLFVGIQGGKDASLRSDDAGA